MTKVQELKAASQKFHDHPEIACECPRCGYKMLNKNPKANRQSMHVRGVEICSDCALDERYRKTVGEKKLSLTEWHFFKKEPKNEVQNT